jgi:hypothetical protein
MKGIKKMLRTSLAVLLGLLLGSAVNMSLILVGGHLIPPPAGADVTTLQGLQASIHLFQVQHFIFPFLAHALGSLMGALIAVKIAKQAQLICAMIVGLLFLLGGISMVVQLPAPLWFNVVDLVLAYLPMAWLGYALGRGKAS